MAPPFKSSTNPDAWWQNAYGNRDDIHVQYEIEFGKDTIKPGTKIKFKNTQGVFKFRCLAHNVKLDSTWIDCIDAQRGTWRAFPVEALKAVVKPKKSRRKKVNDQ